MDHRTTAALNIVPIENSFSAQALTLVADQFCANSTLHQAMKISPSEFYNHLHPLWQEYAFEGPVDTLVAVSHEHTEVVGCIIACPFPMQLESLKTLPEKQRPITALLQALEASYLKNNPMIDQSLLVDIAVVDKGVANRGIYQKLRAELHLRAKEAGYKKIYGELSSSATQHVCVDNLRHKVVSEIAFKNFIYNGKRPFASIDSPASIQLVEGTL